MKNERKILTAFLLNLIFSVFEFIGGAVTGSVAIISDALHDAGDSVSIGISYFLERKSKKQPDDSYTYGYARYSVIGGLITTVILIFGSFVVIYNSLHRVFNPVEINYKGMIIFAVVGAIVNVAAALVTRGGDSINKKAVNLHMLEDVLGWIVVLVGAVIMHFTNLKILDPIISVGVSLFILINAAKNLKSILDLFLEKTPEGIDLEEIRKHVLEIEGVCDVHHIHVRSTDGNAVYATMHVVTDGNAKEIKSKVKNELREQGIVHTTLELEDKDEVCEETNCTTQTSHSGHHHHHHHHH